MNRSHCFNRKSLFTQDQKVYFFKDPIHGSINFSSEQHWLYSLINTREFWRLHSLRQMSLNFWNFPSGVQTRFAHSLGVYELCNRFIKSFVENGYLDKEKDHVAINIALATALLHDIGHGPLSHAFEMSMPGYDHEHMGIKIITSKETKVNKILREKAISDGLPEEFYCKEIAKVLTKKSEYKWIISLITSDFDVDRLDYLIRDSVCSGVHYGTNVDVDLFIKWAVIHNGKLVFQDKIKNSLGLFLHSRRVIYEDLYGNIVCNELEHIFYRVFHLIKKHVNECRHVSGFDVCGFVFERPMNTWEISEFVEVVDDVMLTFMEKALTALSGMEEARKLLGGMFGVWLNEKGEYCDVKEMGELENMLNKDLREQRIFKKGIVGRLKINFFNPQTGELTKFVL